MSNRVEHTKRTLIEAMEASLGVVTTACKKVGVSRTTFYEYYKTDEDFKNTVDELEAVALDFAESQLHKQIKDGNTAATIFYLKTKGKKRGYIERIENDHSIKGDSIKNIIIENV
jgi:AcrR family transcriptional regulator